MDTFGERVREIRARLGISQRELASRIRTTGPTISNWENGATHPDRIKRSLLDAAADKLGTSVEFLLTGRGNAIHPQDVSGIREQVEDEDFDPETEIRLPVYDIDVSAGPGSVNAEFVDTRETLTYQRSWLRKLKATPDQIRIVNVRGSSMEPHLYEGDKVVVHLGRRLAKDNKVFVILYNGDARIKRLFLEANGRIRIASDNPDKTRFPDDFVDSDQRDSLEIVGMAVDRMGPGGL